MIAFVIYIIISSLFHSFFNYEIIEKKDWHISQATAMFFDYLVLFVCLNIFIGGCQNIVSQIDFSWLGWWKVLIYNLLVLSFFFLTIATWRWIFYDIFLNILLGFTGIKILTHIGSGNIDKWTSRNQLILKPICLIVWFTIVLC